MSVEGRVYTVTGAGSGMGYRLAAMLAEEGAIVYASDVNQKGLKDLASESLDCFTKGAYR
jgi:NAD(P)-dependent dehydrogenase (short-subunit alcohol dehydrogenase family)